MWLEVSSNILRLYIIILIILKVFYNLLMTSFPCHEQLLIIWDPFWICWKLRIVLFGWVFVAIFRLTHVPIGDEKAAPIKLHFCPIFPSSKFVVNFLLTNHVIFDPFKVSFLDGDLKEEPILVQDQVQLSEWYDILLTS